MNDKLVADFMNFISNVGSIGKKAPRPKAKGAKNIRTSGGDFDMGYDSFDDMAAHYENTDSSYTTYDSYMDYSSYSSYTSYTDYTSYTEYYNDDTMHGSYQTYYGYGYS